jgi:hypothetical protein
VAIVHVGGETGEALARGMIWDDGADDAVLLAPSVKQGEELMEETCEDPETAAPGCCVGIPALCELSAGEVGVEVLKGFADQGSVKWHVVWGLPARLRSRGEVGNGQFQEPLDV